LGSYLHIEGGLGILLDTLFFPYTFISGMCAIAGWDLFSVMLELVVLILATLVFYPFGLMLEKQDKNSTG